MGQGSRIHNEKTGNKSMKYIWMAIKTAMLFVWFYAMLIVIILIAAMAYGGIKELLK
jgi:hypothetical protein